jgi:hypothetical protein
MTPDTCPLPGHLSADDCPFGCSVSRLTGPSLGVPTVPSVPTAVAQVPSASGAAWRGPASAARRGEATQAGDMWMGAAARSRARPAQRVSRYPGTCAQLIPVASPLPLPPCSLTLSPAYLRSIAAVTHGYNLTWCGIDPPPPVVGRRHPGGSGGPRGGGASSHLEKPIPGHLA